METELQHIVRTRQRKEAHSCLSRMRGRPGWSLVSMVDELFPFLLGEANLKYGSFHMVKMSTFIRRLSMEGILAPETELKIAELIISELMEREWVDLRAGIAGEGEGEAEVSMAGFLDSLNGNNVNNAFYKLQILWKEDRGAVINTMLRIGASSISESLGHTLSCFYPVMEDVADTGHPHMFSALFTYLTYLSRYGAGEEVLEGSFGKPESITDRDELLKICSSGEGIVNLHHMITFYILAAWERAPFHTGSASSLGLLLEWTDGKEKDSEAGEYISSLQPPTDLPGEYAEFSEIFKLDRMSSTLKYIMGLLRRDPGQTADWLFRKYTDYYHPSSWDPHFYTSLYCALKLYMEIKEAGEEAALMALSQAMNYLARKMETA